MFALRCGLESLARAASGEPLCTSVRVGPQAHLPQEGSKPSCLKLLEFTLGSEAPVRPALGAEGVDQSEGNAPGSRVQGAVGMMPCPWHQKTSLVPPLRWPEASLFPSRSLSAYICLMLVGRGVGVDPISHVSSSSDSIGPHSHETALCFKPMGP